MELAFSSRESARGTELSLNTPICRTCAKPQHGVVEFRWSEGAVVYECKECGAFNEVSEIARPVNARPSRRNHLNVTVIRELPMSGRPLTASNREHAR
jgi:hypothetical protein